MQSFLFQLTEGLIYYDFDLLLGVTSSPGKDRLPRLGLLGKENHTKNVDFNNSLYLHEVKNLPIIYRTYFFKIPK